MEKDHKMLMQAAQSKGFETGPGGWDFGPRTPSQDECKIVEQVAFIEPETGKSINPNGVVRCRRESWIRAYLRKGKLTVRQASIADELMSASVGVRATDPLAALRIDSSRWGSDPVADRIDRRVKFRKMWNLVPDFARPIIIHVVIKDMSIRSIAGCSSGKAEARHLDRLQRGLDLLAEKWS